MLFLNRAEVGISEPVLGLDAGFYLFTLPFLEAVQGLLVWVVVVGAASAALAILLHLQDKEPRDEQLLWPVGTVSTALGLLIGAVLDVFQLLYSDLGITAGPGWNDVNVRVPAYLVLAILSVPLGATPFLGGLRRWLSDRLRRLGPPLPPALWSAGAAWAAVLALWVLIGGLVPSAFQALIVEPNEITYEEP